MGRKEDAEVSSQECRISAPARPARCLVLVCVMLQDVPTRGICYICTVLMSSLAPRFLFSSSPTRTEGCESRPGPNESSPWADPHWEQRGQDLMPGAQIGSSGP